MSNSDRFSTSSPQPKHSATGNVQVPARTRPARNRKVITYAESNDDDEDDENDLAGLPYARAIKVRGVRPSKKQVDPLAAIKPTPIRRGRGRPRKNAAPAAPKASPVPIPVPAPAPVAIEYDVGTIKTFSSRNAQEQVGILRMTYDHLADQQLLNRFQGVSRTFVELIQFYWLYQHLTIGEIEDRLLTIGYADNTDPEDILLYLRWSTVFWIERIHHI